MSVSPVLAFLPQFISKRDPEDVKEVSLMGGRGPSPDYRSESSEGTLVTVQEPSPPFSLALGGGGCCALMHTQPGARLGVGKAASHHRSAQASHVSLLGGGLEAVQ